MLSIRSTGMRSPHLLLAGSNCRKLLENLRGVIDAANCTFIENEIDRNTVALFRFGEEHFTFAKAIHRAHWRQKISRYYYGAYNIRRAIQLHTDGTFKTDVSDHRNIDAFPSLFPNSSTYKVQLVALRDDRNLADYGFESVETDLVLSLQDADALVMSFITDAKAYLTSRGLLL